MRLNEIRNEGLPEPVIRLPVGWHSMMADCNVAFIILEFPRRWFMQIYANLWNDIENLPPFGAQNGGHQPDQTVTWSAQHFNSRFSIRFFNVRLHSPPKRTTTRATTRRNNNSSSSTPPLQLSINSIFKFNLIHIHIYWIEWKDIKRLQSKAFFRLAGR